MSAGKFFAIQEEISINTEHLVVWKNPKDQDFDELIKNIFDNFAKIF